MFPRLALTTVTLAAATVFAGMAPAQVQSDVSCSRCSRRVRRARRGRAGQQQSDLPKSEVQGLH
jgi:hypothetical protein